MDYLTSYYRFEAMQGTYTVSAGGYPCGGGERRLYLYEDAFSTEIERSQADGGCRQTQGERRHYPQSPVRAEPVEA